MLLHWKIIVALESLYRFSFLSYCNCLVLAGAAYLERQFQSASMLGFWAWFEYLSWVFVNDKLACKHCLHCHQMYSEECLAILL